MITVLYAGGAAKADIWYHEMHVAAQNIGVDLKIISQVEDIAPAKVDYILFEPTGPLTDLRPYENAKAILSLWAGVDEMLRNVNLLPDIPIVRMVEEGLTVGMTDYIVTHTMRYAMELENTLIQSHRQQWEKYYPPLSKNTKVGILGLGILGCDAAQMLAHLRMQVFGWSRTKKHLPDVTTFYGSEQLEDFLGQSDILILLAPATPETHNLMNKRRLQQLPSGARIINAARGELIEDTALLEALETGHIAGATLDVFRQEPLPAEHPFWGHPKITVTPHIASVTRPETASKAIIAQIMRAESGQQMKYIVNRQLGY